MNTPKMTSFANELDPTVQRWLGEARRTGRAESSSVHRPSARYRWSVPVTIEIEFEGQTSRTLRGHTNDISATGLGLRCRQPIEVGAVIRIKPAAWGGAVQAIVRHTAPHLGEHRIGVEFLRRDAGSAGKAA